jgi:hypothetical protein
MYGICPACEVINRLWAFPRIKVQMRESLGTVSGGMVGYLERVSKIIEQIPFVILRGLKPPYFLAFFGPAKAVPLLQN